ncbi:MAG: NAD(P)/FAD-dependent oxidoreductase [Caldimonas sp.]
MIRLTEIRLPLEHPEPALRAAVLARLGIADGALHAMTVFKRGHDARKRSAIVLVYTVDCAVDDEAAVLARHAGDPHVRGAPDTAYRFVAQAPADFAASAAPRPIVVGFGPCGLFAALLLAQMGFRPLVLERGRAVRERTRDTWGLWRRGVLDPESNVQFGEGGAGTFSDGKLWSQISDPRHLTRKVIAEFVAAGAPEEIAWVAKPHIGTFRLVGVVEKMRAEIERLGGEVRFGARVVDLRIEAGRVRGVTIAGSPGGAAPADIRSDRVVLALGHSARDTFAMLHRRGVAMQAKPFSIGFRIEHPQSLIDRARFGEKYAGHPLLGAADYKLVHHAQNGRSVYSFCMCPGGTVVAATSEPGCVVTNGMSQYSRNERNANAGIVVAIAPEDYRAAGSTGEVDPLDGIAFQRFWESRAYALGGESYAAPGQRVGDFLAGRASTAFERVLPSYQPGVLPTDLAAPGNESLPSYAIEAIREALPAFARQIAGFAMEDAVLTGVETRTSSPLRMPRGKDLESVNVAGLYPCGEGAGYAGGIMSAAVDGIEVAEAVARALTGDAGRAA